MKRKYIYILVLVALLITISITLTKNKKELNQANTPVDRTNVPITVQTTFVKMEPMQINSTFPATIQPYDEVKIFAEASGMISELQIQLGQQVSKEQILGKLNQRILQLNLKKAETDVKSTAINKDKLKMDYERSKDLYDNKAGLQIDMLSAKNKYENEENNYENALNQVDLIKQQIHNSNIIAPLSGIISSHTVKKGEFVNTGTAIATVTNISRLKTTVYVDQSTAYVLKKSDSAEITASVFKENHFTGKIIYISPVADGNHNFQVDLLILNEENMGLKGGTDVLVSFQIQNKENTLTLPETALITDRQEPYVYVIENGKAIAKVIKTGSRFGNTIEVLSGLKVKEEVVYSGQINLHNGSKVEILKNTNK